MWQGRQNDKQYKEDNYLGLPHWLLQFEQKKKKDAIAEAVAWLNSIEHKKHKKRFLYMHC